MKYLALATDYDGTLAHDGHVSEETVSALARFREAGGKVILVTGRELPDLLAIFPAIHLCESVVVENGALLYWPASKTEQTLGEAPPETFLTEVRHRGVTSCSMGRVIFATWRPWETVVLEVIQEMGLELQIIFNKQAVMVLPSGMNKATGLVAALAALSIPAEKVAGIGDAENDHSFLDLCGYSAAVSNALPAVKERANLVTAGDHGRGVIELIDRMLADDLPPPRPKPKSPAAAAAVASVLSQGERL
jgi:hydroxymethylpyrimidine pyrophosphatase-like HAD family hydrolase